LVTGVKTYLKIKLQEIRKYYPDWEYIEIGIKKDHIHLYMVIPPKIRPITRRGRDRTSRA